MGSANQAVCANLPTRTAGRQLLLARSCFSAPNRIRIAVELARRTGPSPRLQGGSAGCLVRVPLVTIFHFFEVLSALFSLFSSLPWFDSAIN